MPDNDAVSIVADTLRTHQFSRTEHQRNPSRTVDFCNCGWRSTFEHRTHAAHVAAAVVDALTQLPERRDGRWPVDLADDDFSVWRISMRRERDGAYVNGSRISWGALQIDLSGDHSRKLAEALLAVVLSEGETR